MEEKNIIVFYHADGECPDGFTAAYSAWKRFKDTALYHPLSRSDEPPYTLAEGKEVYFVDFCYPKEIMDEFVSRASKVVTLDHHEGMKDVMEVLENKVFDALRSGAGIAWDYFHPNTPRPMLVNYVEDDDLFRFGISETRNVMTYVEIQPRTFETWDELAGTLTTQEGLARIVEKGKSYREYFDHLASISVEHAKLVSFEGMEVYFATAHPLKSLKSLIGNMLAVKKGPCALVVSAHPNGYGVSIRGDGSIDVAKIAQKFGGNGHPSSSGFLIPREGPYPWTLIEKDENSSH
jgi:oligoribonuclease NrnB/cAMP/cGMP phosphodiesterase (DHH superfamily)